MNFQYQAHIGIHFWISHHLQRKKKINQWDKEDRSKKSYHSDYHTEMPPPKKHNSLDLKQSTTTTPSLSNSLVGPSIWDSLPDQIFEFSEFNSDDFNLTLQPRISSSGWTSVHTISLEWGRIWSDTILIANCFHAMIWTRIWTNCITLWTHSTSPQLNLVPWALEVSICLSPTITSGTLDYTTQTGQGIPLPLQPSSDRQINSIGSSFQTPKKGWESIWNPRLGIPMRWLADSSVLRVY